jgi:hypothetical protein
MATARPARPARKAAAPTKATGAAKKSPAKTAPQRATRPAAAPAKPAPVKAATVKTEKKKDKPEKVKVVRDSFTIPKTEYAQIADLKKRAMGLGQEVKKSELIRAGLLLLSSHNDAELLKALAAVPTLKTGRPGKA